MSAQKKSNYTVFIDVLTTHQFEVGDANSPEEATMIAEEWLQDGEEGTVTESEVIESNSFTTEEE